jgi:hypothetical protein
MMMMKTGKMLKLAIQARNDLIQLFFDFPAVMNRVILFDLKISNHFKVILSQININVKAF